MADAVSALKIATALVSIASAALVLLFWGMGPTFWSLLGLLIVAMALATVVLVARRDYLAAATPSAVGGLVAVFFQLPPGGYILVAIVLLFAASALSFALYEVD